MRRETTERPAPQIIANGSGSYSPNPAFFGFHWPDVQAAFDRGHRLFERRNELGREQQGLTAEKRALEHDLLQAEAGVALARAGLGDTQIADAATTVDVPKSRKRITAIEKRLDALDGDLAALDLAVQRHQGELEQALAVARLSGEHATEVAGANQADIIEAQALEARAQEIRARIRARESLGELLGMPASGLVA
jgi:chromosome segregation ATPase